MKKSLVLVLAALLALCGVATAETDYAAMPDDDLHAMIDAARNELTRRELTAAADTVLFDQDGISCYLTGGYDIQEWGEGNHVMKLEAVVINDSDVMVTVGIEGCYVNGWEVYGGVIQKTDAGKKQKDTFEIRLYDADIHSYEEIEDIEFTFKVYKSDDYAKIFQLDPITVHFNAE